MTTRIKKHLKSQRKGKYPVKTSVVIEDQSGKHDIRRFLSDKQSFKAHPNMMEEDINISPDELQSISLETNAEMDETAKMDHGGSSSVQQIRKIHSTEHDTSTQEVVTQPKTNQPVVSVMTKDIEVTVPMERIEPRPEEEPDFDSMTSAEMMHFLLQTMAAHKNEIQTGLTEKWKTTEQEVVRLKVDVEQHEDYITSAKINEKAYEDAKVIQDKGINKLEEQVQVLTNIVVKQDNLITELQDRSDTEDERSMRKTSLLLAS